MVSRTFSGSGIGAAVRQWVAATIGTPAPDSSIWFIANIAVLSWPETKNRSGLGALTFTSVADLLAKFSGNRSSMTHAIPRRRPSDSTLTQTYRKNASSCESMAICKSFAALPNFCRWLRRIRAPARSIDQAWPRRRKHNRCAGSPASARPSAHQPLPNDCPRRSRGPHDSGLSDSAQE